MPGGECVMVVCELLLFVVSLIYVCFHHSLEYRSEIICVLKLQGWDCKPDDSRDPVNPKFELKC